MLARRWLRDAKAIWQLATTEGTQNLVAAELATGNAARVFSYGDYR